MMPGVLVFSKIVWTELSQTDRALVRAAAKESVAFMRGKLDALRGCGAAQGRAVRLEVIDDVDRKSFAAALSRSIRRCAQDPACRTMVRRIQADDEVARQH